MDESYKLKIEYVPLDKLKPYELLDIGEWNAVEVRIQLDNGKGDHVEYEGAYGTN